MLQESIYSRNKKNSQLYVALSPHITVHVIQLQAYPLPFVTLLADEVNHVLALSCVLPMPPRDLGRGELVCFSAVCRTLVLLYGLLHAKDGG